MKMRAVCYALRLKRSGSRKHCLGNLVNASALGRVGVLIARQASVMRAFVRQRAYLHFLAEVQKNTFRTGECSRSHRRAIYRMPCCDVTEMARRVGALMLLGPRLDESYRTVAKKPHEWLR